MKWKRKRGLNFKWVYSVLGTRRFRGNKFTTRYSDYILRLCNTRILSKSELRVRWKETTYGSENRLPGALGEFNRGIIYGNSVQWWSQRTTVDGYYTSTVLKLMNKTIFLQLFQEYNIDENVYSYLTWTSYIR